MDIQKGSIVKHYMDAETLYRVIDIKGGIVYVEKLIEQPGEIGSELNGPISEFIFVQ
jgi:phage terminase large subunit GpA-like protein